jgi:hypothetical protein
MAFDDSDLLVVQQHASGSLRKATVGSLLATIPQSTTWERDGTTLKTVFEGDDVIIGDTNITLRSDGSSKYESAIDLTPDNTGVIELRSSDATVQAGSENSNLLRLIANTTQGYTGGLIALGKYEDSSAGRAELTFKVADTSLSANLAEFKFRGDGKTLLPGHVLIGGTLPSAPNIELRSEGHASFGGGSTPTNSGVSILAGGTIKASKDNGLDSALDIYTVGTNDPTIQLNANGSADFAGVVNSGPISVGTASSTALGVQLSNGGLIRVQRPSTAGANTPVFSGFNGNTENITLTSGGAATFAGALEAASIDCGTY